jgi:hypothetical protein
MWEIASDQDIQGFRIYRSTSPDGPREVLDDGGLAPPEARLFWDSAAEPGRTYSYNLAVVQSDGSELLSQTVTVSTKTQALELRQNYPNPFNPSTTITFVLPEESYVKLTLYTLDGRLVRTLINETVAIGSREVMWNGKDDRGTAVSSGVYFYRLTAGEQTLARKMLYLK